jgi:ribA/ribD-fused uncharacterized protein
MHSGDQPEILDRGALLTALSKGVQLEYLLFWGHTARTDGVGKHVLSQWWPAPFTVDDDRYASAEHFMMAEKARLFGDEAARSAIMAAATPREAKALGRSVSGFDDALWTQHRFDIVMRGSLAKFGQNVELRDYLLGTGHKVLVEASPVDCVWGIGLAADDTRALDPAAWRGLNLLGFALMQARSTLAAQIAP